MATYVLDTGILIGYLRGAAWARRLDETLAPARVPNATVASVVTVAELECFAVRRRWGPEKRSALSGILRTVPTVAVEHPALLRAFAEIKAYSEGKHPDRALPHSARPMGDNDIWIAATATVLKATLLTTDHDFDHLNEVFCKVVYIAPN